MDKQALAKRLEALTTNDEKRSMAARLRDVLDDVERTLAAGAKRADVLAELQSHGLHMSLSTFETTLKRLRAERRADPGSSQPARGRVAKSTTPAAAAICPPASLHAGAIPSHDPADLDRIINTRPDLLALARYAKRRKQ